MKIKTLLIIVAIICSGCSFTDKQETIHVSSKTQHHNLSWEGTYQLEDDSYVGTGYIEIDFSDENVFSYDLSIRTSDFKLNEEGFGELGNLNDASDKLRGIEFDLSNEQLTLQVTNERHFEFIKTSNLTEEDFVLSNGLHKDMSHIEFMSLFDYKKDIEFDLDGYNVESGMPVFASIKHGEMEVEFQADPEELSNSTVYGFAITDENVKTHRGISIGDSKELLLELYGEPEYIGESYYGFASGPFFIEFEIVDNCVKTILYWHEL
ncbi:hypothetical protein [Fusibacter sp. JL216-2]|uniref:hypothetical protein n=1 Tax=Fusibacter sp. JL216-2 TaxID=3071453 RepID=UPI003D335D71